MQAVEAEGRIWLGEFLAQARPLTRRWRAQRTAARLLATLWVPLAVLLGLVALRRWTLVDVPEVWILITAPLLLWLLVMIGWGLADRPSAAVLAPLADRLFGLDERLATALQFARQPPPSDPVLASLVRQQRRDATLALVPALDRLRGLYHFAPRRYIVLVALAAVLALGLGGLMLLPAPAEATRAEQAALRAVVLAQAQALDKARRDAVARPNLPPDLSLLLDHELQGAGDTLRSAPTDRAGAVSALSQAKDHLQAQLPADYQAHTDARTAAAQLLQGALPASASEGDPIPPGLTALGKAAAALDRLPSYLAEVAGGQRAQSSEANNVRADLAQAADELAASDPELAAHLRAAADALARRDNATARAELAAAAALLRAADADQQTVDTVAAAVQQLDTGRTAVAQAGLPPVADTPADRSRQPFGRLDPGAQDGAAAGAAAAGDANAPGAGQAAQAGTGTSAAAQGGTSAPPGGPGAPASGQGSSPSRVGSTGGAQDAQGNQIGTGSGSGPQTAGLDKPQAGSAPEQVYVPETASAPAVPGAGPQDTIPVQGDPNAPTTSEQQRGPGVNPGVHTPYQRVIGQYGDSAASALDRSAIPPDAKQYVRDYFSSLEP